MAQRNETKELKIAEKKVASKVKATTVTKLPVEDYDPYEIIKSTLSTEKAIRNIEFDNKLSFIVNPQATKADVKKAVEILFKVRVVKVNLQNSIQGQKRAYVKLGPESLASDVSADLGLI